ncbi:MAG: tripartite tricarboxylate transporter substrate binding protein [Polaromonas sp.]|nr:tripartite tricarboxylate transporter substrate binding protein [Polaromonas sp.]
MKTFQRRFALLLCLFVFSQAQYTAAQTWPAKPIRMIVPQGAGGSTDIWARMIALKMGEALGQQVVVENRPGAGGIIGVDAAAKAAADGYTILFGSSTTVAANVSLYSKVPFDPIKDFTPLAMAVVAPFVFVVNPSLPVHNMKELIALAKSKPGELNYGSGTNSAQICTEMLKSLAGVNITMVPYKSSPQALTDLMAGQLQVVCEPLASSMPQVKAGKLRVLAVTSAKRTALAPEFPTVVEAGIPGFEYTAWVGFFAPAGTPKDIASKLGTEILKVLKQPDTLEKLKSAGAEPIPGNAEELAAIHKADIARLTKVIKEAGIKVE